MPCTRQQVRETVVGVLETMNAEFPEAERLPLCGTAVLAGPEGVLDSLGLVDLVLRLQDAILDEYGAAVAVAGEAVLKSPESPFRTLDTLVDHVSRLLENEQSS